MPVSLRPVQLEAAPGQWMPAVEDALATWSDWCATHPGACAQVGLSAHWLLIAVAEDAAETWQYYYGVSTQDLARDWLVRSVSTGAGQLHCAVPRALIEGLTAQARAHGVTIQWAGPWWIHDLERHVHEQVLAGASVQPWSAHEPGLRVHASLSWNESARPPIQLRQVWCEAEAA
ncbi:MAG: hypothetical protein ACM3VZ_13470 [Acidobacteriota bacterium]